MIHARTLAAEGFRPGPPALITLGSFDGVHLGHQALLSSLVQSAHTRGYRAAVVTFFPHPALVLRGHQPGFYLTSPEEKADLFAALGIDLLVTHPFAPEVSQLTAAQFVGQLKAAFQFKEIWCGADFAFGHNREGTIDWLRSHGHSVHVFEPVFNAGHPISSSRIRRALAEGDVTLAAECLGRPFQLAGQVIEGNKRGHTLGFPTANLQIWEEHARPARGVYACRARVGRTPMEAVTNIGVRPTFDGEPRLTIEAHLLDFEADLYGHRLRLDFVERLRPEQKFGGVNELAAQIRKDILNARAVFARREVVRMPESEVSSPSDS